MNYEKFIFMQLLNIYIYRVAAVILLVLAGLSVNVFDSFAEDIFTKPGLELNQSIKAGSGGGVEIGTIAIWTKPTVPDGWLECNGQTVDPVKYPELRKLMSAVPDYRGRFAQGASSDAEVGTKKEAGLPNIWGAIGPIGIDGHTLNGAFSYGGKSGNLSNQGNWDIYANFNAARCSAVYGRSNTVQPASVIVKYIIKAN